jgi:hypothetical protein
MIIGAKQKIPNTGELKLHLMSGSRVFSVKPWGKSLPGLVIPVEFNGSRLN